MERISSPRKTTMRSLAAAMVTAPEAETSIRTWYSTPWSPSRRNHPSPASADTNTAHDTHTANSALNPSSATAPATAVLAPWSATSYHWNSDTTTATEAVATVRLVAHTVSSGRRTSEDRARMATAPPSRTRMGRIDR